MSLVSIFKIDNVDSLEEIVNKIDKKKASGGTFYAQKSKYSDAEAFIQYWYMEDVENCVKRGFTENEADEISILLRQNGKEKVSRKVYCFINLITGTLEIYRWKDNRTDDLISAFEVLLGSKISPISIKPEALKKLYSNNSVELSQLMFKNIDGLTYDILRGKHLENNQKAMDYVQRFLDSLRVVSFRPNIRFLNGNNKYQITINGDKGTVRFSDQENGFTSRPRFEVRQITFMIASVLGNLT